MHEDKAHSDPCTTTRLPHQPWKRSFTLLAITMQGERLNPCAGQLKGGVWNTKPCTLNQAQPLTGMTTDGWSPRKYHANSIIWNDLRPPLTCGEPYTCVVMTHTCTDTCMHPCVSSNSYTLSMPVTSSECGVSHLHNEAPLCMQCVQTLPYQARTSYVALCDSML